MQVNPVALTPGEAAAQQRLRKTAEDFTATALDELLKPIFDTIDTSDGPFGGGARSRPSSR